MSDIEAPPEDASRLRAFLGRWQVAGVMTDGSDGWAISGVWAFSEAADGWGVAGTLTTSIEGMGEFGERELIGFDTVEGRIHLFSMNRFTIRDHVGGWEGDTLVTRFTSDSDRTVEEIRISFPAPDRMEGSVQEWADGALGLTTDLSIRRQPTG